MNEAHHGFGPPWVKRTSLGSARTAESTQPEAFRERQAIEIARDARVNFNRRGAHSAEAETTACLS